MLESPAPFQLPHADYVGGVGQEFPIEILQVEGCARSSFVRLVDEVLLLVVHLPVSDHQGGELGGS